MVAFIVNLSVKAKTDMLNILHKTVKTLFISFKAMQNLQKKLFCFHRIVLLHFRI